MNNDHERKWRMVFEFLRNQGLSVFSLLLVLLLAAGAFALSYAGLKDLASTNGVDPKLVWIWPLVLDGAIIVFSVCAFRAGLCGESIAYPMFLVVLSTMASIAFNVLHAPVPEGAYIWSKDALVPRIMASIPPLALFLSFEVMVRQLKSQVKTSRKEAGVASSHHDLPRVGALPTENEEATGMGGLLLGLQQESQMQPELVSARASRVDEPQPKFIPEAEEEEEDDEPALGQRKPKDAAEAKALVIAMCKEGALIEEMAEAASRSPQTVRRYIREAGLSVPMAANK